MTERFRFLQGEFRRLRAASDFLDVSIYNASATVNKKSDSKRERQ